MLTTTDVGGGDSTFSGFCFAYLKPPLPPGPHLKRPWWCLDFRATGEWPCQYQNTSKICCCAVVHALAFAHNWPGQVQLTCSCTRQLVLSFVLLSGGFRCLDKSLDSFQTRNSGRPLSLRTVLTTRKTAESRCILWCNHRTWAPRKAPTPALP